MRAVRPSRTARAPVRGQDRRPVSAALSREAGETRSRRPTRPRRRRISARWCDRGSTAGCSAWRGRSPLPRTPTRRPIPGRRLLCWHASRSRYQRPPAKARFPCRKLATGTSFVTKGERALTGVLLRRARLSHEAAVQDVLILSGDVTAIGRIEPPSDVSEVIDLDGRFVLPGLWDRHVHFEQWAQLSARLDLSGAANAAAAVRVVAESITNHPPAHGTAVIGFGFRAALWPDEPNRDLLDAVSGDIPVVLISA